MKVYIVMSNKKLNIFETDIVVVGAGPVGLFTVFEAGMLGMKTHVIDPLEYVGGQCQALYPEKPIYDIPAYPKIGGAELIEKLKLQITPFDPVFHLENQVVRLIKDPEFNGWRVSTNKDVVIKCKAVVIAAGCGAFGPHKPPLENLGSFEKTKSVLYHVNKISDFAGKKVAIAGGGDSAVDWALSLSSVAEKVSLIHRRAKFRAAPASVEKLKLLVEQEKVELVTPYQLHELKGVGGKLEKVRVMNLDGAFRDVQADILLPFFGLSMELGPIANWGLNLDKKHIIVDSSTMQTNLPKIFAVGDVASYKGKLKLILTGFSESAIAAHNIYNYVFPDKPLHFEYSTTKGVHIAA